jgi:hypothetical protein
VCGATSCALRQLPSHSRSIIRSTNDGMASSWNAGATSAIGHRFLCCTLWCPYRRRRLRSSPSAGRRRHGPRKG